MKRAERIPAAGFGRRGKPNVPRPLTPAERRRVEELVARLIEFLDEVDGYPDLGPSSGSVAEGHLDECEPTSDDEPSLGAPNPDPGFFGVEGSMGGFVRWDGLDQRNWASGRDDDRENGDDNGIGDRDGLEEQVTLRPAELARTRGRASREAAERRMTNRKTRH